jgi:hypothetical protein
VNVYDAIYQEQYITIARFNRLLRRLDADPFLDDNDYFTIFQASIGSDLGTKLSQLINKVQIDDTTTVYTPFSSDNDKTVLRDAFNTFVNELNNSDGIFYSNYRTYNDLVRYEAIIASKDNYLSQITTLTQIPFVLGDCKTFQAIECFVEYAPETIGDASLGKQIREATLMFDQYNFTFGVMGFRSDLSAARMEQQFQGEGNGDYGTQVYGEKIYGGLANERPFRTYVPRNHQRCRMLYISFRHQAARENFLLNGYSITYNESTTPRFYKR